jgi:hypothetical protein
MQKIDFSLVQNAQSRRAAGLAAARVRIDALCAAYLGAQTRGATPEERDTWPVKEAAARAVLDQTATAVETRMLGREAAARDIAVAELARLIVARADGMRVLIGHTSEQRSLAVARLQKPDSDVEAILVQLDHDLNAVPV